MCQGKEQIKTLAENSIKLFTSRNVDVKNWIIGDDKAAVEFIYNATIANDLPNGLKAGQQLQVRGMSVYEFQGDKIKRLMDFG